MKILIEINTDEDLEMVYDTEPWEDFCDALAEHTPSRKVEFDFDD